MMVFEFAILSYIFSQEFWNKHNVFGAENYNFRMHLENTFYYSIYGIKEIEIGFVLEDFDGRGYADIENISCDTISDYFTIESAELYVDVFYLTTGIKFENIDFLEKIHIIDDELYKKVCIEHKDLLYLSEKLYLYDITVDISQYEFNCDKVYKIYSLNDMNKLFDLKLVDKIIIMFCISNNSNINEIVKIYNYDFYKKLTFHAVSCTKEFLLLFFNSLPKDTFSRVNKEIEMNNSIFYVSKYKYVLGKENKELTELAFKYFDNVILGDIQK